MAYDDKEYDFSTDDILEHECLPTIEFNIPTFIVVPQFIIPYAVIKVTVSLGCPFDDTVVDVNFTVSSVMPSVSVGIEYT